MKISVIIPAFNVENYICQCLDSVLAQKENDFEIIIVNDGSTDNTQEVIDNYVSAHPDVDIKCLFADHKGPSHARNIALEAAKGEYISFIDADDYLSPYMYQKMYAKAIETDSDLVLCGRAYVLPDGRYDSKWNQIKIDGKKNIFSQKKLLADTSSFVWDKLFKRSTLEDSGLKFNEEIRYAEDALFVYTFLYYAKKVSSIQEPLYYYTVKRKNSITGAMDERMFDEVKVCELLTKFYIRLGILERFKSDLLWICIGLWGRKLYDTHNPNVKTNKKVMYQFVVRFYKFLDDFYPDEWKDYLQKWGTRGSQKLYKRNAYRLNLKMIKAYIYFPSKLFRFNKRIVHIVKRLFDIGLHLPKKIKNRLLSHEMYEPYLKYRKSEPIEKNTVLYIANSGDNIACNVFAMMKEAASREGYKLFVAVKDVKKERPVLQIADIDAKILLINSVEFQKVLATANYLVINYRLPTYFTKRTGQVIINTWHGTPLKTLGRHMNNGVIDLGNVQSQFLASDYLLYPNEYTRDKMLDAFCLNDLYTHKAIVEGYPRNDVFFDTSYVAQLRKDLGLTNKKVYAYMPTWRGVSVSSTSKDYSEEINTILHEIDNHLNDDVVLYVKLHNLALRKVKLDSFKHIRQFPSCFEIYYFINIADALITDYSSVFYDFANTKKDIILFAYDKNEYDRERGMYVNIDSLPFAIIENSVELAEYMNSDHKFEMTQGYSDFLEKYCAHDSICTAKRVNDILFSKQNEKAVERIKYNACLFADPVTTLNVINKMNETAQKPNPLFIIATTAVTSEMVDLLRDDKFANIPILVVQNEHIFSRREQRAYARQTKTHIKSLLFKKAVEREKDRMFPGIAFESLENCSVDYLFEEMARK